MRQYRYIITVLLVLCSLFFVPAKAVERTILLGPKTIGKAWRDNILIEPRHFANAKAGDVLTVYNDRAKGMAQAAFQHPKTWQGVAPEYGCFGFAGPFRMTLSDSILNIARTHGIILGGHDYRILRVTLSEAADYTETIVWEGPAVTMKTDWSASAEIPGRCFESLQEGDGLRLHVSKVQEGAAAKLMDFTWNALAPSVDGMPVGEDGVTWFIYDRAPLLKLQLAGYGAQTAMRVGGKGYRLEKIGIVRQTGEVSEDLTDVQRAPREYVLQQGELFRGEKVFPADWSGNISLTAAPFQNCTENDVLVISYTLDYEVQAAGVKAQLSIRNSRWQEITGAKEPVWYPLDGTDVVYMFDPVALDQVKTRGLIVTGVGFTLTKIELISAQ
ncbi:MAG: hypothetical protein IJS13_07540 [Paludibacteraceae bacterium]|nr:hypothetical protein [Paludibacteraceae bacterium]